MEAETKRVFLVSSLGFSKPAKILMFWSNGLFFSFLYVGWMDGSKSILLKVGVVGLGERGVQGVRVVRRVGVGASASTAILVLHIGIQLQEDLGKLMIFLECWGNNV
jgi:hypothetical protein